MIEIRWHSRGGLGAFTAARLLAEAALERGYWAQTFPSFGPERRGAPMESFTRISTRQIHLRCQVYNPDLIMVLDERLLETTPVTEGLKPDGVACINSQRSAAQLARQLSLDPKRILSLDATAIARACGCYSSEGNPVPNTAMLGVLLQVLGGKRLIEAGQARLAQWFAGDKKNMNALLQGAQAVRRKKFAIPKRLRLE